MWFYYLWLSQMLWRKYPKKLVWHHKRNSCSRMLGFVHGTPTLESQFGQVNSTFRMDQVECTGNESTLLDCPHNTEDDCGAGQGAGVICYSGGSHFKIGPTLKTYVLFYFNSFLQNLYS